MSNLIGYLRVSTQGQAVDGFGLSSQKREIMKYGVANGHTIVSWCQDAGVSGTVDGLEREGFRCVVDKLRAGEADGLIAFDLSRIARALHLQEAALRVLWDMGAQTWTVTAGDVSDDGSDPTRTMLRQIMGAVAQFQRSEQIRLMQLGKARKIAGGGRGSGPAPFGWRAERGELVKDPAEQAVVAKIRKMRVEGFTLREIANKLNAEGIPAKRGGTWVFQQVDFVLNPPKRKKATVAA